MRWGTLPEREIAKEYALGEHGGEFEIVGEFAGNDGAVGGGFLKDAVRVVENHAAGQVAGAHGVIDSLAGDRIDHAGGVAHRHPSVAGDAIPRHPPDSSEGSMWL